MIFCTDFYYLFLDLLEDQNSQIDKDKILLVSLLGLSIGLGYAFYKFSKMSKNSYYFIDDKYKHPLTINDIENDLRLKTNTFCSWLIEFAILDQKKKGYLVIIQTFNYFNFSFFDLFLKYKCLNEKVWLDKFVNKISPSRLHLFLAGKLPKSEVKFSNVPLGKKLFFRIKARSIILKRIQTQIKQKNR
jgi:hypothetical protein